MTLNNLCAFVFINTRSIRTWTCTYVRTCICKKTMMNDLINSMWMQEALSLPDQIDEAIKYIKSLETKLKKSKEKKESLSVNGRKRSYTCTSFDAKSSPKSPKMEIREMGSTLEVVLITGLDNQFLFYEIIHILHEEQAEVLTANFSISGDSIFHVVHAEVCDII